MTNDEDLSAPDAPADADSPAADPDSLFVGIFDRTGKFRSVKPLSRASLSAVQAAIDQLPEEDKSTAQSRRRSTPIPAMTSGHKTPLPGTEHFLVLTGSFGPSIEKQPSLWGDGGFDLLTPSGSLRIEGQTLKENTWLQHYVARELGPEGLKDLAGLLDVYIFLTKGRHQKQDVEVTAKQVLQRIGREGHADDNDEQDRLLNTAFYLARSYVVVHSSTQKRTTPLLVLESVIEDTDGNKTLRYHLGQDFFDALFGTTPRHYALPTPRVIGYHSVKSQHELLLSFFLGNRLALGKGHCSLYFVTVCTQSALYALERLLRGEKNRMRDAMQVIYALERLEQDELIVRSPHEDVDAILAVNLCLDPTTESQLAPATLSRIQRILPGLKGYQTKTLNAKRRIALQRLLNVEASNEDIAEEIPEYSTRLTFSAGPLLQLENQDAPKEAGPK